MTNLSSQRLLLGSCAPSWLAVVIILAFVTSCGDDGRADGMLDAGDTGNDGSDARLVPDLGQSDVHDSGPDDVGPDIALDVPADVGPDDVSEVDSANDTTPDTDEPDPWSGTPCSTGDRSGTCQWTDNCPVERESVPGFCPGPAGMQCCVPDEMVDPGVCDADASYEDMPRPNEGLTEAPGVGGCPSGMIPVDDFCIDRFEGSLVEIFDGGGERSWSPFFNPGTTRVRAVSIAGAIPQGYITGNQAAAACAESGKRLCTDAEWLRACQGAAGNTYPYGEARQPGVCNDARDLHPAVDYFGTSADWIWSALGNACINQQDAALAPAGAHSGCVTAEGAFDMMGNLHEWTADPSGTFRGGFYADTVVNGPGCLYRTTAHSTGHWDYSTGFRCCAD